MQPFPLSVSLLSLLGKKERSNSYISKNFLVKKCLPVYSPVSMTRSCVEECDVVSLCEHQKACLSPGDVTLWDAITWVLH